ncbi:MAG: thioredoxin [Phycisphaerae bacterium]|nr:thioredoxin [Phycisphaerae bacterium]
MAGADTLTLSDDTFEKEVLESKTPVLVDFWAEWCGPCRTLAPVIDEIATEYAGKLKVGKLDIDANQQTAVHYGIQSIPTVVVFVNGEPAHKLIGLQPKSSFKKLIDELLAS